MPNIKKYCDYEILLVSLILQGVLPQKIQFHWKEIIHREDMNL